jgi:hypothetical protein
MKHARHADAKGVKPRLLVPAVVLAVLAAAPSALAVPEQGDAGETPATAQNLTTQAVGSITGALAGGDSDLYRICLAGGGSFSATTVGTTQTNTQLFLFDGDGRGIYANDDAAGTEQSTLPAGDPLTPDAPGEYLLGVSPNDRDPVSAEGAIFNNVAYLVGADGRGAAAPLESWAGRPRRAGAYEITLTGTKACESVAPTIDLRAPAEGAVYSLGESVTVDYECRDETGGSGLASCAGDLADGATLDTSAPGKRTFAVTATDNAGISATTTVAYEVVDPRYDFGGFQWPVDPFPEVNRWPAGFPVPIRFSLNGYQGADVLADGYPQVAEVECGAGESPETGAPARSAWRRGLRYRPSSDHYVYWWKTKSRWAGKCRQFLLKLNDGSLHRAEFRFTRSGWWSSWRG